MIGYKDKQINILEERKETLTPKPSSSVKYSGATTSRKKPLGSVEKIF
jgi:hypothetical protein